MSEKLPFTTSENDKTILVQRGSAENPGSIVPMRIASGEDGSKYAYALDTNEHGEPVTDSSGNVMMAHKRVNSELVFDDDYQAGLAEKLSLSRDSLTPDQLIRGQDSITVRNTNESSEAIDGDTTELDKFRGKASEDLAEVALNSVAPEKTKGSLKFDFKKESGTEAEPEKDFKLGGFEDLQVLTIKARQLSDNTIYGGAEAKGRNSVDLNNMITDLHTRTAEKDTLNDSSIIEAGVLLGASQEGYQAQDVLSVLEKTGRFDTEQRRTIESITSALLMNPNMIHERESIISSIDGTASNADYANKGPSLYSLVLNGIAAGNAVHIGTDAYGNNNGRLYIENFISKLNRLSEK